MTETPIDLSLVPDRLKTFLEESIIPSPHSIDLSRTVYSDYLYRQVRKQPHVAELYHENSKLNPHSTLQPIDDPRVLDQVRRWFFATAYSFNEEEFLLHESPDLRIRLDALPEAIAMLLQPFAQAGYLANLLYSIDLLVLHQGLLTRLFPERAFLWTERTVTSQHQTMVHRKLGIAPDTWNDQTDLILFLVACPWRYMMLHGPRGYRHTLLDVGRILAYLELEAADSPVTLEVKQNFHDSFIDRFTLADGLERSTIAVLTLRTA